MSDLLKISRTIQDQHFQWRVGAAMILHAQSVYGNTTAPAKDRAFALAVLSNPDMTEASMLALVASDEAVVDAVTLDGADGEVPETDTVQDADIKRVVAAMWGAVATKYNGA